MGRIAAILSFSRVEQSGVKTSNVKIDTGGGYDITAQHYSASGDDSFPLETDFVAISSIPRRGGAIATGYLDPLNTPKAQKGDKRIYARDSSGVTVAEVWLKNDGSVLVENDNGSTLLRPDGGNITTTPNSTFDCKADGSIKGDNGSGSFELQAGGTIDLNGVTIDPSGNIITPTTVTAAAVSAPSIKADGKELADHTHPAGTPPGDTGINN